MKDDWEVVPGVNHDNRTGAELIHICLTENIEGVLTRGLVVY